MEIAFNTPHPSLLQANSDRIIENDNDKHPSRSPDWQCLLGTFLFGARYPAWWSDAERQDDWRPRIGIKRRFLRMKSKISSRKIIILSLLVTGLSSLRPDLCTDQHKDQWLFDADFFIALYFSRFCWFMIPFFLSLACRRRRWCFQHVAGLWRVVFLFFPPNAAEF